MTRRSEVDLARPVVAWLRAQGWRVYQEVQHCGAVADIVATRGRLLWAIEVKATLGLAVVGQAMGWRPYANLVSVAGPARPQRAARLAFDALLRASAIGCLIVRDPGYPGHEWVTVAADPDLARRTVPSLRAALRPEHETWAEAGAATSTGARWTPWKATVQEVTRYVAEHPGATLREVMEAVPHHYSSRSVARATISHQIRSGLLAGLRIEGGRVWPAEVAA